MNDKLFFLATLMAQELQEFVCDAREADPKGRPLAATQELINAWEEAVREATDVD